MARAGTRKEAGQGAGEERVTEGQGEGQCEQDGTGPYGTPCTVMRWEGSEYSSAVWKCHLAAMCRGTKEEAIRRSRQ